MPGRYAFAFIALNSLMLLPTRAAQRKAIQTLAEHLAPGGLAAVDVWLPDGDDLGRYDGRLILEWIRPDPATGALVTKSGSAIHDAASAHDRADVDLRRVDAGRAGDALDPPGPPAPRVRR